MVFAARVLSKGWLLLDYTELKVGVGTMSHLCLDSDTYTVPWQ